ncbi:hypothetical protein LPH50_06475 [Xylella taiwanensis]|uniref:LysR substrate-binding domain-containing protein n=1 Tax=Xylella taiwanensis TaxID=1444770 RepID=A0ABS8TV26_9GAMM|nr:hypothetical protein [Xylella taiwanensis]MCD8455605.1 hypothetical protein [Xylella taiwanensis]MCD8458012.1 hypothetical protein [Xylella taiwanensis]MCD8460148.1 hypothetical protein [Xylella taiwanensis]MCD8463794.1 hypothetical protein [Xylella taiwanensis]MCD8464650.1 hypothetical protein [Xylella taiwanensis]
MQAIRNQIPADKGDEYGIELLASGADMGIALELVEHAFDLIIAPYSPRLDALAVA